MYISLPLFYAYCSLRIRAVFPRTTVRSLYF